MFQKPKAVAFARFASEFGTETLMDSLERNEAAGVVYHRSGILGDYDLETEEAVRNLIESGRTASAENIYQKADDLMNQEKSCGAVVFFKEDGTLRFLLIRHVNGGHWSFPKGHVEAGENESQTALREIREETGLAVSLDTGFRRITSYSPAEGIWKNVIYFIAEAKDPQLKTQKEEILDAGWYPYGEAKKKITYPNDAALFEEAAAYLRKRSRG
jgi:8-oxo-dGTP pyrophosphatase MutT (NUDIX family)